MAGPTDYRAATDQQQGQAPGAFDTNVRTGGTQPAPSLGDLNPLYAGVVGDPGGGSQTGITGLPDSGPIPWSPPPVPETKTTQQIFDDYRKLPPDELRKLQQKLKDAGYSVAVTGHFDTPTSNALSDSLGTLLHEQQAQPDSKATLDSILADMAKANPNSSKSSYSGPTTTHDKDTQTTLTDPDSARALITDAITQKLGRKATPEEVAAFTAALTAQENSNPQVTESTTQSSGTDGVLNSGTNDPANPNNSRTQTVSGGVNPTAYTQNYIEDHNADEKMGVDRAEWYNLALQILTRPSTG